MKKLSTKWFFKWSKKAGLKKQNLLDAIRDFGSGIIHG